MIYELVKHRVKDLWTCGTHLLCIYEATQLIYLIQYYVKNGVYTPFKALVIIIPEKELKSKQHNNFWEEYRIWMKNSVTRAMGR